MINIQGPLINIQGVPRQSRPRYRDPLSKQGNVQESFVKVGKIDRVSFQSEEM